MEFLRAGTLVAKATPELPAADQNGLIRYVASLWLASFQPGNYELRAIVRAAGEARRPRNGRRFRSIADAWQGRRVMGGLG